MKINEFKFAERLENLLDLFFAELKVEGTDVKSKGM